MAIGSARFNVIEDQEMNVILGFVPFIAFAVLTRVASIGLSLWAAAAIAAVMAARSRLGGRSAKLLEIGTVLLFGLFAIFLSCAQWNPSLPMVRVIVDSGLLAIVLFSILLGQPFTLQYAREQVPAVVQDSPLFLSVNYRISAVWAAAFAAGLLADLAMEYEPGVPLWVDIAVIVVTLVGAAQFTRWYPKQARKTFLANSSAA
jgi:hypothetical protein